MLGCKTNLNKFKKIAIMSSIFSNHNGMKLETTTGRKLEKKNPNMWRLNNNWVNEETKEEIKRYLKTDENENMTKQNYGIQQKQY